MRRGRFLEVMCHLVGRILLGDAGAGQGVEAAEDSAEEGQVQPSASSSRAMADTLRDQSAVWTASCFRPARVRV